MKKVTVKRIGVISTAKLHGTFSGLVGLFAGGLYSFGGLVLDTLVTYGWIVSDETPGLSYGTILAFGALIGMPLIFGIFGFISGAVWAYIYNLVSKFVGGIEVDLEE